MTRARDLADSADKDIAGTLTLDGLTVDGDVAIASDLPSITLTDNNNSSSRADIEYNFGYLSIDADANSVDAAEAIDLKIGGTTHFRLATGGDISFYEDTGTTAKLFWDASAERLGLGTVSPQSQIAVSNAATTDVMEFDTAPGFSRFMSIDRTTGDEKYLQIRAKSIGFALDSGADNVTIDSSGNVGIGTSSPTRLLSIDSGASSNGRIHFTNTATGSGNSNGFFIGQDSADGKVSLWSFENEYMRFATNNTERMRLNNDGKLSLGNNLSNPDNSLLHLAANNAGNFSILQLESNEGGSATAPDIALYRNSASPADNDNIGQIIFYANNSASARTTFGGLYYTVTDVTDGSEDSRFRVFAQQAGTYREFLNVGSGAGGTGEVCVNDDSADINFRVESNANANAFIVDAGAEFIGMHVGSALAPNGYTERVRIASDGNNQGGSLVFYDQDTSLANGQGIGNIRWYSKDTTGGGEGFKLGIKGRGNAAGTAYFQFYTSDATTNYELAADLSGNVFQPGTDNNSGLGQSSKRWTDVWSLDGSINTSDERLKQQVASLTTDEINAAKAISALFKTYKWNHSVADKGDNARIHSGVIAQQVKAAMEANSLDPMKYAFMCWNEFYEKEMSGEDIATPYVETFEVDDPEIPEGSTYVDRYSIRYSELMSFIHAATEQRLASIETRLDALEAE
jgi:hypothetical protein